MLTVSRISEMLDYATNYGEFDEHTPNGTRATDPRDTATPMNDLRRASILSYKELLAWRDAATANEWQPIARAPKDGSIIVLTWFENGKPQEQWPMQWAHIQRNGLFPGKVGMWTATDGSCTWNDDIPAGAPTHWKREAK